MKVSDAIVATAQNMIFFSAFLCKIWPKLVQDGVVCINIPPDCLDQTVLPSEKLVEQYESKLFLILRLPAQFLIKMVSFSKEIFGKIQILRHGILLEKQWTICSLAPSKF